MKCGLSICGIDGIQIWQRRIQAHTQKNVYGFLHTRSFSSAAYVAFFGGLRRPQGCAMLVAA